MARARTGLAERGASTRHQARRVCGITSHKQDKSNSGCRSPGIERVIGRVFKRRSVEGIVHRRGLIQLISVAEVTAAWVCRRSSAGGDDAWSTCYKNPRAGEGVQEVKRKRESTARILRKPQVALRTTKAKMEEEKLKSMDFV